MAHSQLVPSWQVPTPRSSEETAGQSTKDTRWLRRQAEERVPIQCFAPGTPLHVVEEAGRAREQRVQQWMTSLDLPDSRHQYLGDRWTSSATSGSVSGQGDPIVLTWSVVPDGTELPTGIGEPEANSNLKAFLNGIYGSEATWLAIVQDVFDQWSSLSGIDYVYEPNDDGVPLPSNSGIVGTRGDVRLGGHFLDGNSGTLAYNYFPDWGDMVLDTGDSFYSNTSNSSQGLRNVLFHEFGHGFGLNHNCPIDQTKLMEPFISFAYTGPQADDILGINRAYGDQGEPNDQVASAASLGALGASQSYTNLSIDDNADQDYYSFTVTGGTLLDVTVTPTGSTYLNGPQNANGSCSAGTSFDSLDVQDLSIEIFAADGTTSLGSSDSGGLGAAESLSDVALASSGTYYLRVQGATADAAQLYDLSLTTSSALVLSVSKTGSGTGSISSDPIGIDCGSDCSESYASSTEVTLTATPTSGSAFVSWGGACSGTDPELAVTVDVSKSCSARFDLTLETLTVTRQGVGSGSVSSDPAGIDCGATCSADYNTGTAVELTATASPGSVFTGWGGSCSGTSASDTVSMTSDRTCTATFTPLQSLSVAVAGSGQATITSSPSGISCGATCSASFAQFTSVTLTAVPSGNDSFTSWSGDCSGTNPVTAVTLGANRTCTANVVGGFTLAVTRSGGGSGTVTSTPSGIDCGSDCDQVFTEGQVVALDPGPSAGSHFAGWSGDADCLDGEVTIAGAVSCSAIFALDTSLAQGAVFFDSESSWQSQIVGLETFDTTGPNVAMADEISGATPEPNTWLGHVLTYPASSTPLSRSFTIEALERLGYTAGFTWDDGEFIESDALSPNDVDNGQNDDVEIVLTGGPALTAFGLTIYDNSNSGAPLEESFEIYGAGDVLLGKLDLSTVSFAGSYAFLGVITDQPIVRILFDEDSGGDDVAVMDLRFGVGDVTTPLDQSPGGGGVISDKACAGCSSISAQSVAENFVLTESETIGQIVLWGGYPESGVAPLPDDFTVVFRGDSGGLPGSAVATFTDVPATPRVGRGETFTDGETASTLRQYEATLSLPSPVTLPAGTHWVEIFADTTGEARDWSWQRGTAGERSSDPVRSVAGFATAVNQAPGSSWSLASGDLALRLYSASDAFLLSVSRSGDGSGSVESDVAGIDCGSDCAQSYLEDAAIELTATAASGSSFTGWSGACSGAATTATVTLSADRVCSATFTLDAVDQFELSVILSGEGSGSVSSDPAGISCAGDCSQLYDDGTSVELTATASPGSTFAGWSGACSGSQSKATVSMTQARSCTATFDLIPPDQFALSVILSGEGSGSVSSDPAGIACAGDCSQLYDDGTSVELTATASAGSTFAGWSGACSGATSTSTVLVDEAKSCIATFDLVTGSATFTLTLAGTGGGSVESVSSEIDCGLDCSETVDAGESMQLLALPDLDSWFIRWGGDCSGSASVLDIVVDTDMACEARFDPLLFTDDFESGDTLWWDSRVASP